jgi:phage-related protein
MALNPITLIIIAIVALIAIVIVLYFRFKWFRNFVQKVWEGIKIAAEAVFNAIKAAIEFLWNNVIKPVFGFIVDYFKFGWGLIFGIFSAVWDGIKGAISGIVDVFKFVWDTVYGVVSGAIGAIGDVIGGILGVVDGVVDGIWNAFKGAFNFVSDLWNNTIGSLSFTIPSWVPFGLGGKNSKYRTYQSLTRRRQCPLAPVRLRRSSIKCLLSPMVE